MCNRVHWCRLWGHTGWVRSVCYSPNGQYVVSKSGDKTQRVWNVSTGDSLYTGPLDQPLPQEYQFENTTTTTTETDLSALSSNDLVVGIDAGCKSQLYDDTGRTAVATDDNLVHFLSLMKQK